MARIHRRDHARDDAYIAAMRARNIGPVVVVAAMAVGLLAPAADAASVGNASDEEIAAAGVLVAGDLPATYTASPRDTSSDAQTEKVAKKLAACKKYVAFRKAVDQYPEAKSDDFDQGQTQIDNSVAVFPTAKQAKAAVDAYTASGMPACFGQLVGKLARQAGGTAKSQIKEVKDVSVGDQSVAYEGPVVITESDGSRTTLGFGNLVVRVGRGVAVYSYNHDAQTTITADLQQAVSASGGRLQQALAG
jgi:hypothetical protein